MNSLFFVGAVKWVFRKNTYLNNFPYIILEKCCLGIKKINAAQEITIYKNLNSTLISLQSAAAR
jgi:DTW domain-containing protein YfiP